MRKVQLGPRNWWGPAKTKHSNQGTVHHERTFLSIIFSTLLVLTGSELVSSLLAAILFYILIAIILHFLSSLYWIYTLYIYTYAMHPESWRTLVTHLGTYLGHWYTPKQNFFFIPSKVSLLVSLLPPTAKWQTSHANIIWN